MRTVVVAGVVALFTVMLVGGGGGPVASPTVKVPTAPSQPSSVPDTRVANVCSGGHDNSYVPLAPCRVVDTAKAGGNLVSGVARTFYVPGTFGFAPQGGTTGGCGIPTWATAVTANISATDAVGHGYLGAWAAGRTEPTATSLLMNQGIPALAGVTIPVSTSGITVRAHSASARFVMDVTGYYAPSIYAVVSSNGTLLYSSRLSVTSHSSGSGSYVLTADTSVTSCSIVAQGWGSYMAAAYASGTSINLNTFNNSRVASDAYFQVTVTC